MVKVAALRSAAEMRVGSTPTPRMYFYRPFLSVDKSSLLSDKSLYNKLLSDIV